MHTPVWTEDFISRTTGKREITIHQQLSNSMNLANLCQVSLSSAP
uniref:Uncharacterized protein n=1 Tax=Anguilla anguilla TaxID=7936 RepID=A0A0E9RP49_ANGAN